MTNVANVVTMNHVVARCTMSVHLVSAQAWHQVGDSENPNDRIDRASPAIVLSENLSESCEGVLDLVLRVFGLTSKPRATRWEMSSIAYSASVGTS